MSCLLHCMSNSCVNYGCYRRRFCAKIAANHGSGALKVKRTWSIQRTVQTWLVSQSLLGSLAILAMSGATVSADDLEALVQVATEAANAAAEAEGPTIFEIKLPGGIKSCSSS